MPRNKFGWVPDLPDVRDFKFSELAVPTAPLPSKVDLRDDCSPIEDQLNLGSCTDQALVGALEFLEIKDGQPFHDLSRLFLYYNERRIENTQWFDSGAYLRDGIKSLARDGVCRESLWPYWIPIFWAKPLWFAYSDAAKHTITSYYRITSLEEMKACLADGYPFVFGFSVYESFEYPETARTGIVPMPKSSERIIGGHAVLSVGYDDATGRFLCRNSWGVGWGMQGYFTVPYAYLNDAGLADDMWTLRKES